MRNIYTTYEDGKKRMIRIKRRAQRYMCLGNADVHEENKGVPHSKIGKICF